MYTDQTVHEMDLGAGQDPDATGMPARDKRAILYATAFFMDALALVGGYLIAIGMRDQRWLEAGGLSILTLALPVFVMIAIAREAHSVETLESRLLAIKRALGALGATALIIMGLSFVFGEDQLSRLGFSVAFGMAAVLIVLGKICVDWLFGQMMDGRALATILLADGAEQDRPEGMQMIDVGTPDLWPDPDHPDKIDRLSRLIAPYDRVIVSCVFERRAAWAAFLKGSDVGGEIILDRNLLHGAVMIGEFEGQDTLVMSLGPLNLVNRLQKRAFDLIIAGIAVLLLSPVLLVTALAIKLDSPGPVFFRQRRVGQGNRQFEILKFRSMRAERHDAHGDRSVTRDDDRITRVGRLIRSTSIDELPQLLNVLKGEMSMVGPRPHALGSRAGESLFWHASKMYWMRHALKPGLTGLAQIRGFRGATETERDLQMRVRCDLEYLGNWSLWADVMIMLKTARVLIHKNAY